MKIKVRPEDFVVEEILNLDLKTAGPYTILKLVKHAWNTLDAIDFISRRLKIPKKLISRAGLKDRYGLTTQFLSVRGNLTRGLIEKNLTVTIEGRSDHPVTPAIMRGNRFWIVLRDLKPEEPPRITRCLQEIQRDGLPNYFDDQRFGSAWHKKGFFAHLLIRDHVEGALKLLLGYPYPDEPKPLKSFKNYCRAAWGNWEEIFLRAPRSYQPVVAYLVRHPRDFRGAIKQIDRELLNLYLLAYQSYLFNEILCRIIRRHARETMEVSYTVGTFVFGRNWHDPTALFSLKIPMINAKTRLTDPLASIIAEVLEKEDVTIRGFSLNKMRFRGVRFKSFLRPALICPQDLKIGSAEPDELYAGRQKMAVDFTLPSGCYATILIKRLLA